MRPTPINAIGVARSVRPGQVPALAREAGLTAADLEQLEANGLEQIPVAPVGPSTLAAHAFEDAVAAGWDPATCTSGVIAHSLELTADELDQIIGAIAQRCPGLLIAPFAISGRPCSIVHEALAMAAQAVARHGGTSVVLGVDVAPTHDDRFFFGSAMGDAAVAVVLGHEPRMGEVLAIATSTHVVAAQGVYSSAVDISRFRTENPIAIRATISAALAAADLGWESLTAIIPHTPYHAIWDTLATLSPFPRDQIFDDYVKETGHLNANDVIVHFDSADQARRIAKGDVVALMSPGFGGSRGCTVIRR